MSPRRLAGVTRPPGLPKTPRPLAPVHGTQRPGGAKRYALNRGPEKLGGPGPPPPWFLTGNQGADEWPIYDACRVLFHQGPGQGEWLFQTTIAAQLPGGVKPDFVLVGQQPNVVMRVQSSRYHLAVDSWKAAYDVEQFIDLERFGYVVIDVFPQYYLVDEYGPLTRQASIRTVREAQQHRQRLNPRGTQTSFARG
jgi:hypothetical protein